MAPPGKTFRIFVSSTFSDLKEERNALQERVFPRLRGLCMANGFRFQAIDLRWGVSEEAALDQQTVRICLEEIARCQKTTLRPNFIVLLGDRYGWRPLPWEIPADEFEAIEQRIGNPADRDLLNAWYRRDDNAVSPVYVLQRRTGEFIDTATWEMGVERPLSAALLTAVAGMDLPADRRLKYAASATEQEIVHGALNVEDAGEHVFCFFRSLLAEMSDGSMAIRRKGGSLSPIDEALHEGELHHFVDRGARGDFDHESHARLADLKRRLEMLLLGKTMKYESQWTDSGVTLSHLDSLCTDVYDSLSREILKQIAWFEKTDPVDEENRAHEEFGEDRARFFVGRAAILDKIRTHIKSWSRHPLAIHGESGSGKSALMAQAVREAKLNHPEAEVIARFIGATPASSDGRSLLEDLCRRIGRAYGSEEETPLEYRDLVREFPKRIALATEEKPLILFLDALDQLSSSDRARSLAWLPPELPDNVSLVVSAIPGECTDAMKRKFPPDQLVEIEPMPPEEGAVLLDRWLSSARRTLRHDQKSEVIGKFAKCGMPLFLKLAFEEARHWKSYDDLKFGADRKPGLSEDVPGLIDDLLRRLSREEEHGEVIVSRSLGYIAAGKNGLTEDELLDVLSGDGEVIGDFQRRSPKSPQVSSLPVVVLSRLRADLEPYLTERRADGTSLISFYHHQFGEAIARNYLTGDSKLTRHESLARYFSSLPLWSETDGKKTPNVRKVSELPFQQAHGGMATALKDTLTDFDFMYAKVCAVGPQPLIADYDIPSTVILPNSNAISETAMRALELIKGALCLSMHLLARDSNMFASQLTGRLMTFEIPEIREMLTQVIGWRGGPWLRPITPGLQPPGGPLLRTVKHKTDRVRLVAVTPDGRYVISGYDGGAILIWDLLTGEVIRSINAFVHGVIKVSVTRDGRYAVTESADETLRVWDLETGEMLRAMNGAVHWVTVIEITSDNRFVVSGSNDGTNTVWNLKTGEMLQKLRNHTERITAVTISPDSQYLISGFYDGTITVWKLETGEILYVLQGNGLDECVMALAVTPDGRCAISGSSDGTLKVLDLKSGEALRTLKQLGEVNSLAVTPDGRHLILASLFCIQVWDLINWEMIQKLEGHTAPVYAVATTQDCRFVITGSSDGTVKVWDLQCNDGLRNFQSQNLGAAYSVAVTPDGQFAVSACNFGDLKKWDLKDGVMLRTFEGLAYWLNLVSIAPDGRHVVSDFGDKTLIVWDLESEVKLCTLKGHTENINVLAVTPDSRYVVSGSDDGSLKVWDLENGRSLRTLKGHMGNVNAVAVTPDSRCAVSGSSDGTLRVWDLKSGKTLRKSEERIECVFSVAVTPDGRCAVSGWDDGTLMIWNLNTGVTLHAWVGHAECVNAVAVTPDGRCAISGSSDGTLKVWDLERNEFQTGFGGDSGILTCAIGREGKSIIASEDSGKVHILHRENYVSGPSIVTAFISLADNRCALGCLQCRCWSFVPESALGTEIVCSKCASRIKLNPFTINADWRPIEKAWRGTGPSSERDPSH